jgi:hypothetical protein
MIAGRYSYPRSTQHRECSALVNGLSNRGKVVGSSG